MQVTSIASQGNDAGCAKITQQQCPSYGPKCAALKACCATLSEGEAEDCLQLAKALASQNNEAQCQQNTNASCSP